MQIYDFETAINDIDSGLSIYSVSKKYGIPESTLRSKYKNYEYSKIQNKIKNIQVDGTLFLYDIHIPYQDGPSIELALDFAAKNYNIVHVVLGGDILDCEALSKYDKTRTTKSFIEEVIIAKDFLSDLRNRFKQADITYLMGNHEERLEKYLMAKAPEVAEVTGGISDVLDLPSYDINFIDNRVLKSTYGSFFKVNDFTVIHGHELGICPIVSPAYKFLEKAKSNLILGHIHVPDEAITPCIDGTVLRCYSVGTLGRTNPKYRPFNRWCQGFLVLEHRDQGDIAKNYKIVNNTIY